jgi:hypothetical protein
MAKRKSALEKAGLKAMGTATVQVRAIPARPGREWRDQEVRLYVDAKGTRYVDSRDMQMIDMPVPTMIHDGDGGFLQGWQIEVDDLWSALAIDALVECWKVHMQDKEIFYSERLRLTAESLIAALTEDAGAGDSATPGGSTR